MECAWSVEWNMKYIICKVLRAYVSKSNQYSVWVFPPMHWLFKSTQCCRWPIIFDPRSKLRLYLSTHHFLLDDTAVLTPSHPGSRGSHTVAGHCEYGIDSKGWGTLRGQDEELHPSLHPPTVHCAIQWHPLHSWGCRSQCQYIDKCRDYYPLSADTRADSYPEWWRNSAAQTIVITMTSCMHVSIGAKYPLLLTPITLYGVSMTTGTVKSLASRSLNTILLVNP